MIFSKIYEEGANASDMDVLIQVFFFITLKPRVE